MGLLDNRVFYNLSWEESSREQFKNEDIDMISQITVVAGDHGLSAKVITKNGKKTFYPIHRDSNPAIKVDDNLDPNLCWIIHLKRGEYQTTDKLLYEADPIQ